MKRAKQKKKIRPIIVVGIILLLLGLALILSGFIVSNFNLHDFCTVHYETKSYEISEPFTDILIQNEAVSITVVSSSDGLCRIESDEASSITNEITVKDGTLSVTRRDIRHWYEKIFSISFVTPKIVIHLPAGIYNSMTLATTSGDITVNTVHPVSKLDLYCSSGSIYAHADVKDNLSARTYSGDIKVFDSEIPSLRLSSERGKISLWGISSTHLNAATASGDIRFAEMFSQSITATSTSGKITLIDTDSGAMTVKTDSGKVMLRRADAQHMLLETNRGDVTGSIASHKIFDVTTREGTLTYPASAGKDTCTVRTQKGDVKLELELKH